jgi:hypothetical protein
MARNAILWKHIAGVDRAQSLYNLLPVFYRIVLSSCYIIFSFLILFFCEKRELFSLAHSGIESVYYQLLRQQIREKGLGLWKAV